LVLLPGVHVVAVDAEPREGLHEPVDQRNLMPPVLVSPQALGADQLATALAGRTQAEVGDGVRTMGWILRALPNLREMMEVSLSPHNCRR
jgi:hypothetical protein